MFDQTTIEQNLKKLFPDAESIKIRIRDTHTAVTVSAMYEKPQLGKSKYDYDPDHKEPDLITFLTQVRDACGAERIDLGTETARSGCDTCDYGSEYGWEFLLR